MYLRIAVQVCSIEVSLWFPDIGSLEFRKIIQKTPAVPVCIHSLPGQCSCHGKWLATTDYCDSTAAEFSLLLLCSSALQGDHIATKVQNSVPGLFLSAQRGTKCWRLCITVAWHAGGQEHCVTEVPWQYRKTLHMGKPRYSQLAHCHRSRPVTELNWAELCWHAAPWMHASSDILFHSQKDTAMVDTYWIFVMRIIYSIWD